MNIKTIKERWKAIKALLKCDEYFLGVAWKDDRYHNDHGLICYDYINNTDRDLFYTFIHDFIENNLRSISGKFICVRSYEDLEHDIYIPKGSEITFDKGYANVISCGNVITYKMPIEEIFSHFKFISK